MVCSSNPKIVSPGISRFSDFCDNPLSQEIMLQLF
jgi:hypothetical protein